MSKSILKVVATFALSISFHSVLYAQDVETISQLIQDFSTGIDTQDGELLTRSFYAEGIVYGFAGDGASIITLSTEQFSLLHEEKRFGGQQREISVKNLSITDGLLASASVDAFNEDIFYNYRMTFIKLDASWQILSVTQRSRSN